MANLRPADAYYGEFTTQTPSTGAATAADSLPTATATRNGADDATFTLTCASLATGRYKVTGTIPSGYAAGDAIQISVSAVMGGVTGKAVIDSFVLDSKRLSDLNDLSSTQAATATQTGLTAQGYTGTLATNLGTTNTRVALALPNAAAGASGGLPLSVDASGRVDVLKVNGTSQTARDIGASVLLSNGTGTGQLSLSSGAVLLQPTQTGVTIPTVTNVGTVGTLTTYTGNTPQTGDAYARIGAAGAGLTNLGDTRLDGIGTADDLANDPTLFGQAYRIAGRSDNLPDLPAAVGDIPTAAQNATATWANGTRTLSSFGTLVADTATAVWAATVRTLTAFSFTPASSNPGLTSAQQTELDAVKAKTDNLPAAPAAVSDVSAVPAAVVTALKADSQWKKLYAYSHGKFDFDPATGILRLYDVDNTTVLTTFTLTKDVSGNTTARTVS